MARTTARRRRATGTDAASRRRIGSAVRKAALGSYGVRAVRGTGLSEQLLSLVGLRTPGVRIRSADPLRVEVNLALVEGVPPAAVASNVTKAVRYVVQRDIGRSIEELVVLVGGQPLATAHATGGLSSRRGA